MERLNAYEIKIGILSDIRKRIVRETGTRIYSATLGRDLRGIVFTEQQNIATDILHPLNNYPIVGKGSIYRPVICVSKYEDLCPLLEYYGLYEFSYDDLQKFIDEILLNKQWLKEYHQLFGFNRKKYGPLTITYKTIFSEEILPYKLGKMIYEVQDKNGLSLSKKEQRQYKAR